MATAFLLIAPSAVGDGTSWCPPEVVRGTAGATGTPDAREMQELRELTGEIRELPGVRGVVDHDAPAGTRVLVEDDVPPGTRATLIDLAVDNRFCLATYDPAAQRIDEVLVNATGQPTDCLMWDSRENLVLHADRASLRDLLDRDAARQADLGGRPFAIVEPVDDALSPVPGVRFVQTAPDPDGGWTVEHRTGDLILGLADPVPDIAGAVQVIGAFLDGDAEEFLGLDWEDTGVVLDADGDGGVPGDTGPSTLVFFRAADVDDAPEEFRTTRDFNLATDDLLALPEDPATGEAPVPEALASLAAWMNRRALRAAEDPANPPAQLYMDFEPYPVRPHGTVLAVTVPSATGVHDDICADLMLRAGSLGLCMLEDTGRIWVNASGPVTGCRMAVRGGGLVTSVTRESLRATLESAVFAGTEGFVLSVEPAGGNPSPVEGTGEVQVGIGNRQWIVHRLTTDRRLELQDPPGTVEDVVDLLTAFTDGDAAALSGREWTDITGENDRGARERWLLSDSAGGLLSVGEAEVHVAVPMNYAPDLAWFQVADQVVRGDYITADRHLGTQWSVMWGHGFGEVQYYRRIVDTREDAEALIHAWIDEPEQDFLARGWELVDND